MTILEELKFNFRTGGTLIRLIFFNVGIFLLVNVAVLISYLFNISGVGELAHLLSLPASPFGLLHRPWTPISYMFVHIEIFHVLGNVIMLYFGGRLFTEFLGQARLMPVYLLGGLFGALLFFSAFNILPAFEGLRNGAVALGASASVLAVFFAIASYLPNYEVNLLFIGFIRLKWLAIILLVFDLISISRGNPGGHIAHIGGALFGYLYATQLRKGRDLGAPLAKALSALTRIFRKKPEPPHSKAFKQVVIEFNKNLSDASFKQKYYKTVHPPADNSGKSRQEIIDEILDKISRSGYDSLSREEKETIFRISREE